MDVRRLLSYTRQAVDDYGLIEEDDKIAVGISGGKDSLTLLYALKKLQRFYPKRFELTAITVHMGFEGFQLEPLKGFCEELQVPYEIVDTQIAEIVFGDALSDEPVPVNMDGNLKKQTHPCSLCARLRKGALNQSALSKGCNKIAYAHHRDDVIETMLLSLLYEGRFHSFSPETYLERSGLTVIRPMLYIPEAEVIGFSRRYSLPAVKNPCPADGHTRRQYIKDLLRKLNQENRGVKDRMFTAILSASFEDWPKRKDRHYGKDIS